MRPARDATPSNALLRLESYPEVRRLLLLTLVLLALWFSDVRGPIPLESGTRRRVDRRELPPARADGLPELTRAPIHARRSLAALPAASLPRRARRR